MENTTKKTKLYVGRKVYYSPEPGKVAAAFVHTIFSDCVGLADANGKKVAVKFLHQITHGNCVTFDKTHRLV